ncbi:TPA: hypothetical protein KKX76_003212 [Legionella pneumophila]|uniref:hypothetical protein n=1 Tax=Legionella pneumophila TaxID=446 RepID=UPI0010216906|nr:hypothetical protein [Legionella pneumophila]RYX49019.1 hypothetical protein D7274_11990 [Legionella pneumophila]HAT1864012.1 hypothetical protein [Legionella pneumophila]HAU1324556.1 hypothetical protein [Legionella pneumophila]HAU1349754.1 hypothetical protein [Legionella pneumophila]HAU2320461.1 hypothetical protein [Legionella pneumophila]
MNEIIKKLTCISVVSIFGFPAVSIGSQESKLPPRVFAWGNAGNRLFGEGDAMIPLVGNSTQSFFMDLTGKYGNDDAGLLSAGLGSRTVVRDNAILGVYLFGDYNRTPNSNNFKVVNPGIEGMTRAWDAHLNGYFPVGKKSKTMAIYTGTQAGISNTVFFSGHSQYDKLFDLLEDVGAGTDFEIGRTFLSLNRTRLFAGGYYFSPKYSSAIKGVEGGIEMPLKYRGMQVGIRDSYDNINHNTIALTLRVTFGGLEQTPTADIHERMLDLIPRHLGNLRSGDGIPSQESVVYTGRKTLIQDNIWFFNADGTPSLVEGFQSCTFEHPCIGLAQTQIDTINTLASNANFYLSSGTYNNPDVGSGFSFYNGQNISGRTSNFMQLATGGDRPLLNDSLLLNGNNNVYNMRVFANSILNIDTGGMTQPFTTGVLVTPSATGVVNIYNTDVVSRGTTVSAAAVVNNSPTTTLNINNSTLASSILNIPGAITIGAANVSSGSLNINGSSITVTESDLINNFDIAFGVVNNENGTVNIANTNIAVSSTNAGLTAAVLNNSTNAPGIINITGSTLTVLADNSNLTADVFNQANNISGVGGTVNIDQSSLSMTSNNNGGGLGAGVFNTAASTVNLTNSVITSSGNEGTIAGILNSDPLSTVNFQNNSISLNLSGTAIGMPIINGGTVDDNGGNQCFQNGVPVPC